MNYQGILLNEEGRKLLKLKEEVHNLSPEIAESFINVSNYKKELLDKRISISFFEEILKSDSRFILSKKDLIDYNIKEYFKKLETLTDKDYSVTYRCGNYNIEIYVGMTNKNYVDYMNTTLDILLSNEIEHRFAVKVATRRVNAVINQIEKHIRESIKIPKCHSKNINIEKNVKPEIAKRYLYDGVIHLSFPEEYILEYKNLTKIILEFLDLAWEGIEKYKTW